MTRPARPVRLGRLALLPALALVAGLVRPARAEDSTVEVHPRLGGRVAYDDNIFLAPSAPVAAWILTISPGLGLLVKAPRDSFGLDYQFDETHYTRFSGVNDGPRHTLNGCAVHRFAEDSFASVEDTFLRTTDPASNELVNRSLRHQNDAGVLVELPLGPRFFVGLAGVHTIVAYRDDPFARLLNRTELAVGPRLGITVAEKTRAYVFYKLLDIGYVQTDTGRDSTGGNVGAGVEWAATDRLTGMVEAGMLWRRYVRTDAADANAIATGGATLKLTWAAPGNVVVTAAGGRTPQESVFTRFYIANTGSLSVTTSFGGSWTLGVLGTYGEDHYSSDFPFATTDAAGAPAVELVRRLDRIAQAGVTAGFQLYEHQRLEGQFLLRHRGSNVAPFDYDDHLASLSAVFGF